MPDLGIDLSQFPPWALYLAGGGVALIILMVVLSLATTRRKRPDRPARGAFNKVYAGGSTFVDKGDERRRASRRTGNPVNVLISTSARGVNPFEGVVVDRSEGGLRLSTGTNFALGSTIYVKPAVAPPEIGFVQVEVMYCQPAPDSFLVGCRFVVQPPLKVLLLFG